MHLVRDPIKHEPAIEGVKHLPELMYDNLLPHEAIFKLDSQNESESTSISPEAPIYPTPVKMKVFNPKTF